MSGEGGEHQSLTVVADSVGDVGKYVFGIADELRTALKTANTEVAALIRESWTGTAADEFEAGWSEAYDGGSKIAAALVELAEKLGVTAETYRQRDESNASALSATSLDLP
ncbi:WXG100 family type VII secretion target [Nocardia brasiliensis]|uniref:WXG100 family type VII secretion target n=1 Tax=Nocardia brasiliensis TaxID=37326 RepID=UPI00340E0E6D